MNTPITRQNPRPAVRSRTRRARAVLMLAATLTGGTVFTSCEVRFKEAVVAGLKDAFYSLLDPNNFLDTGTTSTNQL